jgi:CubicO group peptidase (beta-lactamase class C family)
MLARVSRVAGLGLIVGVMYALNFLGAAGPVGAGYYAKVACSAVFVSGRGLDSVLAEDLRIDHPFSSAVEVSVDPAEQTATATFGKLFDRTAVYREGLGCTLATDMEVGELREQASRFFPPANIDATELIPWPTGDADIEVGLSPDIDQPLLALTLERAFSDPDPEAPAGTRAVVVVHRGRVVAERYAGGITAETPLVGWSMTKSVFNALVGILVGEGRLDLDQPAPVAEWSNRIDPRNSITLRQLLRMSSGLRFKEEYSDLAADAPAMLFNTFSAGAYAARKPLISRPGTRWRYSSGTSNILSRIVRETVGGSAAEYWSFPRLALFERIGMRSAILEPDSSGVLVGSSFCYATARDWARLGLLYLNDGVWQGERVLPEGWVEFTVTPARHAPQGRYGAHVWLNAGEAADKRDRRWPGLPVDLFYFSGYEGQTVAVVPSRDTVVVRLGCTKDPSAWSVERFLIDVLSALPGGNAIT